MLRPFFLSLISASWAFSSQPNIVLIYADDLGYGDLGCYYEGSKIPTPHLDKLAEESLRFTDGHSSSGICTPSRYAMLTGRYHWRDFHGIVNAFGKSVFKAERLTLPEMLQGVGYHTAVVGKWHLGWDWEAIKKADAKPERIIQRERKITRWGPEDFDWTKQIPDGPLAHGFDYYFGDTVINFPPYCWIENDRVPKVPDTVMDPEKWPAIKEGNWECRPGPMTSDWNPYENIPTTTKKGVQYIKERAKTEKPFFLYFAFPSPHAPIIPNDQFDGKSGAGPYGDFVYETDDAVGQLLEAISSYGLEQNTIVVFTADNGPERYAYPRDENFNHWSAHPLRGLKRDIYEGGHRVPFLVKYPGVTQPGVSDALIGQIDLMATFAAITGASLPQENAAEDSLNFLPVLKGEKKSVRGKMVHNTFKGSYAMRSGDWLLLDAKTGHHSKGQGDWMKKRGYTKENQTPKLFHLGKDLGQKNDVSGQNPKVVKRLQRELKEIRERL